MPDSQSVFRFAPSPTGTLHIGGARTALFNHLVATSVGGRMLLRIEDTDTERSSSDFVDNIVEGLRWLQIMPATPPTFQSQFVARYEARLNELLDTEHAYYCSCTPERLAEVRASAQKSGKKPKYDGHCRSLKKPDHPKGASLCVRAKFPESGETAFDDLFRGLITVQNEEMDDLIIRRSNGSFAYNFAVVCDDAEMGITHVLRGDDHINNTPRQIVLYQLMNLGQPTFGHLPMILGSDKKRLSKRHGATAVTDYRSQGFLASAMLNFLVRLGWSHGDEELFFNLSEIENKFDIKAIGKSAAVFNEEKLRWINQQHLKKIDATEAVAQAYALKNESAPAIPDTEAHLKLVAEIRDRAHTLIDLYEQYQFVTIPPLTADQQSQNFLTSENGERLELVMRALDSEVEQASWSETTLFEFTKAFAETHSLKINALAQPMRIALAGRTTTPSLFLIMAALGKSSTLSRLEAFRPLFN